LITSLVYVRERRHGGRGEEEALDDGRQRLELEGEQGPELPKTPDVEAGRGRDPERIGHAGSEVATL
jgi:hypothetical protein